MHKQRDNGHVYEYDVLRVIVTLLVVISHCSYIRIAYTWGGGCDYTPFFDTASIGFRLTRLLSEFLYSFHMPLFMALSGAVFYLALKKDKYTDWKMLAKEKSRRLLIPYVFATLFSFFLKYISGYFSESTSLVRDALIGQGLMFGNTHLWFLPTLFVIFIIAYVIEKWNPNCALTTVVLLVVSCLSEKIDIPILSKVLENLVWFYLGVLLEKNRDRVNQRINLGTVFLSIAIVGIAFAFRHMLNASHGFLKTAADFLTAAFGSAATYTVAYTLSDSKIIYAKAYRLLLKNSFGIYLYSDPWNYVVLAAITAVMSLSPSGINWMFVYAFRLVFTLGISITIAEILRKLRLKCLV